MTRQEALDKEAHEFGAQRVDRPEDKTRLVRGVFDSVARRYDLMNDLMSGGLHRLWKQAFLSLAAPRPGEEILDLAGGTGDIARGLDRATRGEAIITICDLTPDMMRVGRSRALDHGQAGLRWVAGNAEALPFAEESFDCVTIAFGLRNVTRIDTALTEITRVLKPGGRFLCLEFSQIAAPLRPAYDLYSFGVLPLLGRMVAGDAGSYRYLAESIRRFPTREDLARRMEAAGMSQARWKSLSAGIVAIHSARRPMPARHAV